MSDLRGLLGLALILLLAFALSSHRSRIPWRTVVVGLAVQVAFALLVLRWSVGKDVLDFVSGQVKALIDYTNAGIDFLFGKLVANKKETIFALQVLPVIIFLGALVGLDRRLALLLEDVTLNLVDTRQPPPVPPPSRNQHLLVGERPD